MDFMDRPLVDYQLDIAEEAGCENVVMAVGHQSRAVEDVCRRYGGSASLKFADEDVPLGTGGALANALRHRPDRITGLIDAVSGRGLCAHPTASAAAIGSAANLLQMELANHARGACGAMTWQS